MTNRPARAFPAAIALVLLVASTAWSQGTPPAAAAPRRPRPPAPAGWPATVRLGEATAVLEAPQAESFEGGVLKAKGAVSIRRPDDAEPALGSVFYEADTTVDRTSRVVTFTALRVPRVQVSALAPARLQRIAGRLAQELGSRKMTLPLDDVLAAVKLASRRDETAPRLGTDPPRILFTPEPAVLVVFDGEPRFKPVEKSKLERAQNTPFLVLHDAASNMYYLDGGTAWFRAAEVAGPWSRADAPPEALGIARQDRRDAGIAEAEVEQAKSAAPGRLPNIVVAFEPTELVVADGPPRWEPLVPGALDVLANTTSDVFRTPAESRVYVVVSGRWFAAESFSGPWSWVAPDRLPAAFSRIPANSTKASVLAFVPGTPKSREAVRDATTPRTAAIKRADAHVSVTWDGEPRFESVPGTHVEYALNTPEQVLRVNGRYYVCDQGVWFASDAPAGPWAVTDSIPDDDLQSIPPESPAYNTRFVTVYDSTPSTVYVAYTPAYLGSYSWNGTVVYGTGWAYRPWWGAYYYPRPWTWGFARWAPWGGWAWGFGWGPAWAGFRYGFGFGWGARWCGPGAFYRPVYANVTVNRTVNVTRNVYHSGANVTRASAANPAAAKGVAKQGPKTAAARPAQGAGKGAGGKTANGAAKGEAAKTHAGGAKGGHAGAHPHAK